MAFQFPTYPDPMPAPSHGAPPPPEPRRTQAVANEAWPQRGKDGRPHARDVPMHMGKLPVRVRVEWQDDGVEVIDATATRWTRSHVYCEWSDRRLPIDGLWVRARDVVRRET